MLKAHYQRARKLEASLKAAAAEARAAVAAEATVLATDGAAAQRRGIAAGPFQAENPQDAGNEPCCSWCGLPLGELAQASPQGNGERLHVECIKEALLQCAREEDEATERAEAEKKRALRAQFGIGWNPEAVTPNQGPAAAMGCRLDWWSPGLCSVVLSESSDEHAGARLEPCDDPSASVNLEYLTLAMQTIKLEGRAPFFSLEPVAASDGTPRTEWLQAKKFGPDWLEGTSVGEVMFQADVYMKELTMGEHPQPVVGMRSCMDIDQEQGCPEAWSGRVWFVIHKAEMRISEEGALLPSVVMAARAREQVEQADGSLVDKDVTRPDHPLLKYAEDFTRNFDLIAERMSVINHLRELARATVLATFLRENGIALQVPELWEGSAKEPGPREIPQLWNVRAQAQLHQSETEKEGIRLYRCVHQVYGGVSMGFDTGEVVRPAGGLRSLRQPLRAPRLVPLTESRLPALPSYQLIDPSGVAARPNEPLKEIRQVRLSGATDSKLFLMGQILQATAMKTSLIAPNRTATKLIKVFPQGKTRDRPQTTSATARQFRPRRGLQRHLRDGVVEASSLFSYTSLASTSSASFRSLGRPEEGLDPLGVRGVDLQLDADELPALGDLLKAEPSWNSGPPRHGSGFWGLLASGPDSPFGPWERKFFQAVYSLQLSDRRSEGEFFVPLSLDRREYCSRLESLLQEERAARERRRRHFGSAGFSVEDPGPLFPYSWAAKRLSQADGQAKRGELHERPEYTARQVQEILQRAALVFEKRSEDGATFRVYRVERLEIRTIQEPGSKEEPVAIFSSLPPPSANVPSKADKIADHEVLLKVTEYVHRREEAPQPHFFVVLETPSGLVLSEMLARESAPRWLERNELLEDRLSGAKALRCADCDGSGLRLGATKAFRESAAGAFKSIAPREVSRRYADGLFRAASLSADAELQS